MRLSRAKRSIYLAVGIISVVACLAVMLRQGTSTVRLPVPASYPAGSELYYLAWIRHGSLGQRGGAARKLLLLPNRREYEITRSLWQQERWKGLVGRDPNRVIRNMLTIALFDLRPAEYRRALTRMVQSDPREPEEVWVKTDVVFEGEQVDFLFDPAKEAAFHLVKRGYADAGCTRVLTSVARSYYPSDRQRAAAVFRLFPGLPAYDPAPQPRTINEVPAITAKQVSAIEAWFRANGDRLRWSPGRDRYELMTPPA